MAAGFACLLPLSIASAVEPGTLLSRYPAGDMPVEPQTIGAILTLGETGQPSDLPLLDSIVQRERSELSNAANTARERIRTRRRADQRATFAAALPDWPELERRAPEVVGTALNNNRETRASATYAAVVLGIETSLGATGRSEPPPPLIALGASQADPIMLENTGEVRAAVRAWALGAASGSARARQELDGFGIDSERLLLGMLALSSLSGSTPLEAGLLSVLVRDGDQLTVEVLSSQAQSGSGSSRATATDALVRMLDEGWRSAPLDPMSERTARVALRQVSASGPPGIREIAQEGL